MRAMLRCAVALMLLVATRPCGAQAPVENEIASLLHRMFDTPSSRLEVSPIAVVGDHAIADWTQGDLGGRALLRNRHGQWAIILCAGDGIRTAQALSAAGVPTEDARQLEARLRAAESLIPPQRLQLLSRFEGTVMMGDGEPHHAHDGNSK